MGKQPEERVILAFNTKPLPEASNEFEDPGCDVDLISGNIIYHIIDKHEIWMKEVLEQKKRQIGK